MMLAMRPNIGLLGYYLINKSPTRLILVLGLFCVISLFLLQRSKESLSLNFMTPVLGGRSVIFLPHPDYSSLNSFDACAVESALNPSPSLRMSGGHSNTSSTPVYLYLWVSHIGPQDIWVRFLSKLKGVTILYLNLVKSLQQSPLEGMLSTGGWGGRPAWAIWMASGGSLLWRSGGILLPTGVLMTKPVVLEAFGKKSGLLVTKDGTVSPIAFGTPPHHPVINQILDAVQNLSDALYNSYTYQQNLKTPLENLLSDSVSSVCDLSSKEKLAEGECKDFIIVDRTKVMDINFEKASSLEEEKAMFLQYTGDPNILRSDLGQSMKFFRKYGLIRYCPQVFRYLEREAKNQL